MAYVSSFIFNKQTNIAANKSTSIRIPSKKGHVNATFSKSYPQLPVISFEVINLKYFIFFILGACIISFLKVIALDYPQISITRRSHCDSCDRILRWFEIIPIIGYFIVHGRCFSCKNQIDFWNPIQELLGGGLTAYLIFQQDTVYLPLFFMLVLLSFSDFAFGYIYPIFYLLSLPTIFGLYHNLHPFISLIIYLSLLLLSKKYLLGLGDIEVIAILSLIFDLNITLKVILMACFMCIISYLIKKKRSFRFIPYLAIATGIVYLIFSFKA
ncbi:hypothetical protein CBP76_10815 [Companilactobacillus nuruki]|uniref:Prepilin peptidase A24 N-terminal domain-containing protein n=1 Tax=Companilactobacillus nuruki TaxID=1993540 RepID=A0A2N7ARV6_9LACO|nr:hypothetical protein CBP76_10815 [Companilactobacillus nuruki]